MMDDLQENTQDSEESTEEPIKEGSDSDIPSENSTDDDGGQEQEESEDYKEKYYYLAAEMENLRRRHMREKEEIIKYGMESVLRELLEVVDNFERTLKALEGETEEKIKNIHRGIDMVNKQFLDVLKNTGLGPLEAIGKTFDPNFHEAISQKKEKGRKNDEIVEEYQKGYILNGRLLRPSKVVIVKN